MDEITEADLRQLYCSCLLMYKDSLVFVHKNIGKKLVIQHLHDNKVETVPFSFKHFKALSARLGYVNTNLGCMFISRKPIRRYSVGLNTENTNFVYDRGDPFIGVIYETLKNLRSPEFCDTAMNNFPHIEDAYHAANALETTFAFDRQFAVKFDGTVMYRGNIIVGHYHEGHIEFDPRYSYLTSLLDGSHGKSARIVS